MIPSRNSDEGELEFREDIYGRDKALLAILKSDERRIADYPVEHRENTMRGQQGFIGFGSRSFYPGRDNFFSRLFEGFGDTRPGRQSRRRAAGEGYQPWGYYR
jgi:hypothetical protein